MFGNWFGGDDENEQEADEGEWSVSVSSNVDHLADTDVTLSVDHVYSRERDGGTSTTGSVSPSTPRKPSKPGTEDGPEDVTRGKMAFPRDKPFMQAMEIRGKNGAHPRVETVYVVTGDTYTRPTDVFALDDPKFFSKATPTAVSSYGKQMAKQVAANFADGEAPRLVARFHTHPSGKVIPSATDQKSAEKIRTQFEEALGTTDFEFFHGIHAYREASVGPGERHAPEQTGSNVCWYGEQYRHELGVFDARFQTPKEVVVE
ncbi:hypothetical protein [Halocalculus aciditolerans]|uniref:JAB domain-containing protein n=1 Tax=Halocalculus aciditolerans TaxID=1383812 RepID=A0A830FMR7_9EURY|nr:hypothetical protein [Halocalculus aciditolerans]GGL68125.1 hypothetical protein GCM10009039_27660 [Halocalculus aciditolerans]